MGTRRYQVTATDSGCELQLADGYGRNETAETREFRALGTMGYVWDTTDAPGTSGRQVCETLFGLGSTLTSSETSLAADIRRMARRHCDAVDRENGPFR